MYNALPAPGVGELTLCEISHEHCAHAIPLTTRSAYIRHGRPSGGKDANYLHTIFGFGGVVRAHACRIGKWCATGDEEAQQS